MNLDIIDNKYILFINYVCLASYAEDKISIFLKDIFLLLSDVYSINLFGYFKVDIYIDKKIGIFIEIDRLDDYVSYNKKIDTKVMIIDDGFYLKTNDLSKIYKYKKIYSYNNNYYISTKDVDNITDIVEFCDLVYKDFDLFLNNCVNV